MKKQLKCWMRDIEVKTFTCGADYLSFAPMLIKVHTYVKIENNQYNDDLLVLGSVRLIILT